MRLLVYPNEFSLYLSRKRNLDAPVSAIYSAVHLTLFYPVTYCGSVFVNAFLVFCAAHK